MSAVGSLRAERGADLSAEVDGTVESIQFRSGDSVQTGQKLLRLRAADEIARLESLKATAALAEINFKRDTAQFEAEAISQAFAVEFWPADFYFFLRRSRGHQLEIHRAMGIEPTRERKPERRIIGESIPREFHSGALVQFFEIKRSMSPISKRCSLSSAATSRPL